MRLTPALCLILVAGCVEPDPDLRPAPPRRAAFGEAHPEFEGMGASHATVSRPYKAWEKGGAIRYQTPDAVTDGWPPDLGNAFDPALSLDGWTLACTRWTAGEPGSRRSQVLIVSGWDRLEEVSRSDCSARHPGVSPDGTFVAWEEVTSAGERLWVTDRSTGRDTFLTAGSNPSWSPDGEWIAFELDRGIWKVRADGSEPSRLTTGRDARRPTWSPDSNWISFGQFEAEGKADDIWAVRADGSRFLRITWDPAPEWDPCWAPDGRVYFTTIRNGAQGIWVVAPENTELLK